MKRQKKTYLALAALLLALGVSYGCWDASTKLVLADAQARCRAAGLPVTIDEIRPPHMPDADNAALVFDKISRLDSAMTNAMDQEWMKKFRTAHPAYLLDSTGTQELAAVLDAQPAHDVLAFIREAVIRKGYDAQLAYEKGWALTLPNLAIVRNSAKLLRWHTRLAASQGQTEEACADVWDMTVLAEFLADEPILISQLTPREIWRTALEELEQLAVNNFLSTTWNQKFADRLAALNLTAGFARSIDGERVFVAGLFYEAAENGTMNKLLGKDWIKWSEIRSWNGLKMAIHYSFKGPVVS